MNLLPFDELHEGLAVPSGTLIYRYCDTPVLMQAIAKGPNPQGGVDYELRGETLRITMMALMNQGYWSCRWCIGEAADPEKAWQTATLLSSSVAEVIARAHFPTLMNYKWKSQ